MRECIAVGGDDDNNNKNRHQPFDFCLLAIFTVTIKISSYFTPKQTRFCQKRECTL